MTEQQIPKLVGALVEHQSAFSILPTEDGQWVIQNTRAAIGLFADAIRHRPKSTEPVQPPKPLLKRLLTVKLAGYDKFVVQEKMKEDTSSLAELPIGNMSSRFREQYLELVETDVPEMIVAVDRLQRRSLDAPIRIDLGDKHELSIGQFFNFLKTADRSKWYFCYSVGKDGWVKVVDAFWNHHGWHFSASSITSPDSWERAIRVVSRNSDPSTT